ncbi:actin nucleation-promoting factor WAS-like [Centroberyx affinis]|uniref:actin nucleation-promoting factor WAS-like n=1 Tax=Centroberyx affinis TaxID=166261 RepID=UPI003A5BB04A
MAAAVAQLYMALPHSPSSWSLQHTGVVCFIKDNPQRSYFIRIFDMKVYCCTQPYFHTFAADDCQVGLNFATVQEAEAFQHAVEEKINQRNNRQDKKQRPLLSNERENLPPLPHGKGPAITASPSMAMVNIQNPDIQPSRYRSVLSPVAPANVTSKSKKEKKSKKKSTKLSKADMGAPSVFKHVTHVGWDPNNLDPDLLKLLSCAGVGEAEMRDEETSQLIYNIIEQSGGMEAVKKEVNQGAGPPPPPPGRQGPLPQVPGFSSSAPAPPPPRGRSGPLPPVPGQPQRGGPPQPAPVCGGLLPPPPTNRGGPPPPPTTPSGGGGGGGGSGRGALLDQMHLHLTFPVYQTQQMTFTWEII